MNSRFPLRLAPALYALAGCTFFFLTGAAFIPRLGLQNDEALFGWANFEPKAGLYILQIGHSKLPIMLMNYLGTLKSWLYRPIFRAFGTGIWTLRLPMLLAGVAGVWFFYLLLRRAAGERAALIGCALLSADSMYLLTLCLDWGPVALQHLLVIGGMLLLLKFWQDRSEFALAGGSFLFGLAMWDKALAGWMLSGLAIAGILTYARQIFDTFSIRRLAVAALSFSIGALPLIIYNANTRLDTFQSTIAYDTHEVPGKLRVLIGTADGSVLFGWVANEDWQTIHPHSPHTALERASAAVASLLNHPRHGFTMYAFFAALLLAPLGRWRDLRLMLFALIAMAAAWVQMALTANAGGSVHHSILLWPLPQMFMGVSFAAASRRFGRWGIPVLAAALLTIAGSNIAVTNEYYALAVRNGGSQNWTDAIFYLSNYMKTVPANDVFCMDWGILDSLRILNRGKLRLRVGTDPLDKPVLTPGDVEFMKRWFAEPRNLFVAHTRPFEFFPGLNSKLVEFAGGFGYQPQTVATISDSYGRPTYEIYRFAAK